MRLFNLAGNVAVVTGGNGGIGLGMARGLGEAGASLVITGRNKDKNKTALEELQKLGTDVCAVAADITDLESCRRMIAETMERFGRLDILVNNAGTNIRRQPQEYTLEEWHTVINTNLTGAMLCCQLAYPLMLKVGHGKIINIGSMMSIFGAPFAAAYAASKGGIVQYTKALATAWAKDNIQVNAVLPGWIDTELTRRARVEIEGLHERVLARTPAGRWGIPEDHAGIAVFLASEASDFITGSTITVDGGYSIQA